MSLDVAVALYGTMLVPAVYWVGAHQFLPGGKFGRPVLASLVAVALCSLVGFATSCIRLPMMVALSAPIYQFGVYFLARKLFIRIFDREPVDVAFNFASGLLPDRVYAFSATLGSIASVWMVLSRFFVDGKFSAV